MSVRVIYIASILLFTVSLLLSSCTVAYNSIQFKKSEGATLAKLAHKNKKKKFKDNVVFLHVDKEILQLKNVEINDSTEEKKSLTGETIMVDHHYERTYYLLRNHKRDRMNELEAAGPKCAYFKQTHIFADSVYVSDGKIQIQENQVEKITMYYRARVLLYILLAVGIGGFLLLWFLIKSISDSISFA